MKKLQLSEDHEIFVRVNDDDDGEGFVKEIDEDAVTADYYAEAPLPAKEKQENQS